MYEVAGFGNPLLDITVQMTDNILLQKYNFEEDSQIDLSAAEINSLFAEIAAYPNYQSPGGCAQNTLRILQWLLNSPNKTVYFGGIGNDEYGRILINLVEQSQVSTKYLIHGNLSTGICIALVKDSKRTLVAHLGAAEVYNINDISNETLEILKSVKICYIEGFFLIKRLEVSHYIRKICITNNLVFAFNLCGSYLCKMYPSHIVKFSKCCDLLFGNKNEFLVLAQILNIEDPKKVALMLNKSYRKVKTNNTLLRFGKIVVITNGEKSVFCVYDNGKTVEFEVPYMPIDKIKDTTGAGDAFVAGFLAALLMNYDIMRCLKSGCWTANQIIQQKGCTVPSFIPELQSVLD